MEPSRWPDHLNAVLAKSADRGGETLAQHTWDVLAKLAALRDLRPAQAQLGEQGPPLWHCLFWTGLLHDCGKAALGFQKMLTEKVLWKQRHEVLSLAFFDWIASALAPEEQRAIVAAIVSHHRDASIIQKTYPNISPDPLIPLLAELDPEIVSGIWHWVNDCASEWIGALTFSQYNARTLMLMPHDQAVALVTQQGVQRVRYWLKQYDNWIDDLQGLPQVVPHIIPSILLRGLTITADHMASAHLKELPPPLQESWQSLARRILSPGQCPYPHQEISAERSAQCAILIAPTGSGKTEAALYWSLGDGSQAVPRLFYILPYQASMNAMFLRLQDPHKGFPSDRVGLQHGRAVQALYTRLVDQETAPGNAAKLAAWEKNINMLHARPVKVSSPYQLLKAAFQLRGFEGMFTDYAHAAFIFDEIHAYEAGRLALTLALVSYLREHYKARFFVMSATFPSLLQKKLLQALALSPGEVITANTSIYQRFQRHRLYLLPGDLLESGVQRIVADFQSGKSVLVCANSIRRAQALYQAIFNAGVKRSNMLLIHSRYIIKHRMAREKTIIERCGVGAPHQPLILIATQVVEVSLNLDLDTLYSDPAPLEALLQRFGRVNREGKKAICPVFVFQQPFNGQYVYDDELVRATLIELRDHQEKNIDESQITTWLDHIYEKPAIRDSWEAEYQRMARSAKRLMENIRPFESNPQSEQTFEEMFDNVDVVPERFAQPYLHSLEQGEFLDASQYLVGISKKKYHQLQRKKLVLPLQEEGRQRKSIVRLPYTDAFGLLFETGRSSEDLEDIDWD